MRLYYKIIVTIYKVFFSKYYKIKLEFYFNERMIYI